MLKIILITIFALLLHIPAQAEDLLGIYSRDTSADFDKIYEEVRKALDEAGFAVVFSPNMGQHMSKFAKKWGDDYNRNQLDNIRSIVFCNIWHTNSMANADPRLMALCPLHISVISKQGTSTVLFPRISRIAEGSEGLQAAQELEDKVIGVIEETLSHYEQR